MNHQQPEESSPSNVLHFMSKARLCRGVIAVPDRTERYEAERQALAGKPDGSWLVLKVGDNGEYDAFVLLEGAIYFCGLWPRVPTFQEILVHLMWSEKGWFWRDKYLDKEAVKYGDLKPGSIIKQVPFMNYALEDVNVLSVDPEEGTIACDVLFCGHRLQINIPAAVAYPPLPDDVRLVIHMTVRSPYAKTIGDDLELARKCIIYLTGKTGQNLVYPFPFKKIGVEMVIQESISPGDALVSVDTSISFTADKETEIELWISDALLAAAKEAAAEIEQQFLIKIREEKWNNNIQRGRRE